MVCICLRGCVRVCVPEYVPACTCAFAYVLVLPKSLCSLHTVAVHSHFPPFVFPAMQIAMSKGRRLFVSDQLRLPPLPLPLLDSLSLKSTPGEQVSGSKPRCRSHMLGPAFESHLRLGFYIRCLFGWLVVLHILAWLRVCVRESKCTRVGVHTRVVGPAYVPVLSPHCQTSQCTATSPSFVFPVMHIAMSKGRRLFMSDQLWCPTSSCLIPCL